METPVTTIQIESYTYWLNFINNTITHLRKMDIETSGVVDGGIVEKLVELQTRLQEAGFGGSW